MALAVIVFKVEGLGSFECLQEDTEVCLSNAQPRTAHRTQTKPGKACSSPAKASAKAILLLPANSITV